jgi:hypothetical protein
MMINRFESKCSWLLGLLVVLIASTAGIGQDNDPMKKSAERLADALRKARAERVAVLPMIFVDDQVAGQGNEQPVASASNNSLRIAEQMQRYLSQAGNGDFGVVPSEDLVEGLAAAKQELRQITPTDKKLAQILNPDGRLDALVIGTLRKFFQTLPPNQGGGATGLEQQAIDWSIIDLSDRTIIGSEVGQGEYVSLAEAVYHGLSVEYFRYENGKLRYLLDRKEKDAKGLPLRPSDPLILFDEDSNFSSRAHPLLNPNCPFKVDFLVGENTLPINVATQVVSVWDGRKARKAKEVLPYAVINLEPGDKPIIRLKNRSQQNVAVAVFVDGLNSLGKVRELPDEKCHVWSVDRGTTSYFNYWGELTGEVADNGKGKMNRDIFVIRDWRESFAGQMGLQADADSSRAFTLVFFTVGLAKRKEVTFFPRPWLQRSFMEGGQIRVIEELQSANTYGAAPGQFGMGGIRVKPSEVILVQGVTAGTMLASMHVWYCPSSDTKRMFKTLSENHRGLIGQDISIVPVSMAR